MELSPVVYTCRVHVLEARFANMQCFGAIADGAARTEAAATAGGMG